MKNLHKLAAVTQLKLLCISQNTMIIMGPVMVLAMVWGCKILYGMNSDGEISPALTGLLLSLGITMNLCTDGFVMVGTAIAEEKEKHTLRVLMTSSITGMQYCTGSIVFPFFLLVIVNYAVLWISGISPDQISILPFFLVSIIASLISCVIGMIVGICAKNQMNASLISYPLMTVFMMVPVFGNLSDTLKYISRFLFTGVMTEMTDSYANKIAYIINPLDIAVLLGELVISILIFLILYKKNGFEKD